MFRFVATVGEQGGSSVFNGSQPVLPVDVVCTTVATVSSNELVMGSSNELSKAALSAEGTSF